MYLASDKNVFNTSFDISKDITYKYSKASKDMNPIHIDEEVAKKAGCKNSTLMHFGKNLPIEEIKKCKKIGISSGASALLLVL